MVAFGSKILNWAIHAIPFQIHNFSVTQILREINVNNSGSTKSAIFTHLEALNFDLYEFLISRKI